jgi:hypothetical protein
MYCVIALGPILKYFRRKIWRKIWRFLLKMLQVYFKKIIYNVGFEEKRHFLPKNGQNCRKL